MIKNKVKHSKVKIDYKYIILEYYIPYISALILAIAIYSLPILAILHIQGYINLF